MNCQKCGSTELQYNRDSALVANALEVRREDDRDVLILDADPVPEWMDDVAVICTNCGHEQEGLSWDDERPEHRPQGETPLHAEEALDELTALLNEYAEEEREWDQAEICNELVKRLRRTGRKVRLEDDA